MRRITVLATTGQPDLWNKVHEAFRRHRKPDQNLQGVLDRIAAKCLTVHCEWFTPGNCEVYEKTLSPDELRGLKTYHPRDNPAQGYEEKEPIILVDCSGTLIVIDGINRVNRWLKTSPNQSRKSIVLKPRRPILLC
jgi:hypothetical protein